MMGTIEALRKLFVRWTGGNEFFLVSFFLSSFIYFILHFALGQLCRRARVHTNTNAQVNRYTYDEQFRVKYVIRI